jgi:ATP-dependent DNA helicase RecG
MFHESGWAEQKGTGIRAMQQAMAKLGLTPPTFVSDPQDRSFQVTFYRHHFMDRDDLAWLEQFHSLVLSTEEQKALVYARKTGQVDNAAFRSLNRTDTLAASRALTHLEGLGLLCRSAQRRGPGVYYTLVAGREDTTAKGAPKGTPNTTPKTKAELLTLLSEGKRLARADTEMAIIFLCAEQPRSARELAELLHRNVDYVRNAYLSELVNRGHLQLIGAPNDPNVTYRGK